MELSLLIAPRVLKSAKCWWQCPCREVVASFCRQWQQELLKETHCRLLCHFLAFPRPAIWEQQEVECICSVSVRSGMERDLQDNIPLNLSKTSSCTSLHTSDTLKGVKKPAVAVVKLLWFCLWMDLLSLHILICVCVRCRRGKEIGPLLLTKPLKPLG